MNDKIKLKDILKDEEKNMVLSDATKKSLLEKIMFHLKELFFTPKNVP